ncbi:MAG: DUF1259 domain-containing protein [Chitinophagaceae bacterium]|nr:DUF1259 domain-containing protein [Chitinophagaceae bacterium]
MKSPHRLVSIAFLFIFSCDQPSGNVTNIKAAAVTESRDTIFCMPGKNILGMQRTELTTGMKGMGKNGDLSTTVSGNELNMIVDGFKIIPLLELGSWAPFALGADSAMIIGDIVVTENNLASIQREVIAHGLKITDIHKYPSRDGAVIVFMHIIGSGNMTRLSTSAKAFFETLKQAGVNTSKEKKAHSVIANLNIALLDSIIGHKGEVAGDVYKYTIGRPDVLRAHGIPVSAFLEFNTWAAWQGTDETAVVAGDFTMLRDEVGPVIKALAENDFEGVAVHNHLVHEEPGIFFLHYWGVGNAEKLAKGLKAALNQQEKK